MSEDQTRLDDGGCHRKITTMNYDPAHNGKAFWQSVLIGAFSGVSLQLALASWYEPIKLSEVWAIPVLLAGYGLFAVPFVGLGLAFFGLPFASLLRPRAHRRWVGLVAIIWGGMAGKIFFYVVDHVLFFGFNDLNSIGRVDLGLIYGVPTGVAWWLLQRRAFAAA